jgi:glycosyltransferase involved in cell wall biosynthesis
MSMQTSPIRATFVLEQVLGHVTQSQNFKRFAASTDHLDPHFIEVTFFKRGGLVERLPLPPAVRASLRARFEIGAIRGPRPDVYFFNTQKPALFCPDYIGRTPLVIGLDVTPLQYDRMGRHYAHGVSNGPAARLKHAWNRRLFRSAARLIPLSDWCARSLIEDYGVRPERITVVPPGVDTAQWSPASRADGGGPLRLLFVGGDFDRKGGPLVLDWFMRDPAARDCELHLVTRDAIVAGERVIVHRDLANNSDRLRDVVRSCDIFVLPTHADCHSLASIEAMASGLPVVATNVGGIPEIIIDGVCGYIIEPGDATALGDRLRTLIVDHDARRRMSHAARERAQRYFDARTNVGAVVDELLRVTHDARDARAMKQRNATGISQT